jgi:NAD(P)-dependent dehydrogenase (short-subunit alcohol dehydrogenase family)
MSRIFITGSTEGLGRAAAIALLDEGHEVLLHARSAERAKAVADLSQRTLGVVIGDLSSAAETKSVAAQVNAIGAMDAVIHNAGVYELPARDATPEGHARTLAINTLAPFILTALIKRPARLIYLSSGLHRGGEGSLDDLDWTRRDWHPFKSYCETKLHLAALASALARRWPDVLSNAVDPGWVPTRMGGPSAPDDLEMGHQTQVWLAASDDPEAKTSGFYWRHRERQEPAAEVSNPDFQDQLIDKLSALTGVRLP